MKYFNRSKKLLTICISIRNFILCLSIIQLMSLNVNCQSPKVYVEMYSVQGNNLAKYVFINQTNKNYWMWLSNEPKASNLKTELKNYFFAQNVKDKSDVYPLYNQSVDINCTQIIKPFSSFVKVINPGDSFIIYVEEGSICYHDFTNKIRYFPEDEILEALPILRSLSTQKFPFYQGEIFNCQDEPVTVSE